MCKQKILKARKLTKESMENFCCEECVWFVFLKVSPLFLKCQNATCDWLKGKEGGTGHNNCSTKDADIYIYIKDWLNDFFQNTFSWPQICHFPWSNYVLASSLDWVPARGSHHPVTPTRKWVSVSKETRFQGHRGLCWCTSDTNNNTTFNEHW